MKAFSIVFSLYISPSLVSAGPRSTHVGSPGAIPSTKPVRFPPLQNNNWRRRIKSGPRLVGKHLEIKMNTEDPPTDIHCNPNHLQWHQEWCRPILQSVPQHRPLSSSLASAIVIEPLSRQDEILPPEACPPNSDLSVFISFHLSSQTVWNRTILVQTNAFWFCFLTSCYLLNGVFIGTFHNMHFFYTHVFWGLKLLHSKVWKFTTKLPSDKTAWSHFRAILVVVRFQSSGSLLITSESRK